MSGVGTRRQCSVRSGATAAPSASIDDDAPAEASQVTHYVACLAESQHGAGRCSEAARGRALQD